MAKEFKIEKDYYFSYENVRQKLRDARRLCGIEHFKGVTVLEMLARLLRNEAIGIDAYGEVEWRAFGITADNIEKIAKIIEKPDEIVRVFTYISDHAYDVLPLEATQEEIEAFELACDSLVCKVIDENKPPVKGGYDENKPYLRLIGANYNTREELELTGRAKIIFEHMWKPSDYQYTNLFPFESICCAAKSTLGLSITLYPLPKEGEDEEQVEMPDIEKLLPTIRALLLMMTNRPVRNHEEPMIQTLFVMSVFAKEAGGLESPTSRYMIKFSNKLIDFIKEKYYEDVSESVREAVIEIRDYMMSAITESINKHLEQEIALGEIKPIEEDEDDDAAEKTPAGNPDSSFFTCSTDYPYESCKKQLIEDINTSSSKLHACRNIRRSTAAGYFQLVGKTNEEKARLINPWVTYTNKDYVFTKDDFRKAPNVKRKH